MLPSGAACSPAGVDAAEGSADMEGESSGKVDSSPAVRRQGIV
jgi:hypothetical protein